jgi:predicted nuclease with TOPRIM domain
MSTEQAELLEGIKGKILSVKVLLQEQRDRNRELSVQNEALQLEVQQKQSRIKELEERNQKLALVKGILAEGGNNDDARMQINRIVREIDKCIALLNRS